MKKTVPIYVFFYHDINFHFIKEENVAFYSLYVHFRSKIIIYANIPGKFIEKIIGIYLNTSLIKKKIFYETVDRCIIV